MFAFQTEIKAVSPSEEFTCCLGIDPALRVLYKPLVKRHDQSGLLTKSKVTTYEQRMEIRNTHLEAVKILVIDQLPLSLEEKIKVCPCQLLSPCSAVSAVHYLLKQLSRPFIYY